jgi:hypothetical protein
VTLLGLKGPPHVGRSNIAVPSIYKEVHGLIYPFFPKFRRSWKASVLLWRQRDQNYFLEVVQFNTILPAISTLCKAVQGFFFLVINLSFFFEIVHCYTIYYKFFWNKTWKPRPRRLFMVYVCDGEIQNGVLMRNRGCLVIILTGLNIKICTGCLIGIWTILWGFFEFTGWLKLIFFQFQW